MFLRLTTKSPFRANSVKYANSLQGDKDFIQFLPSAESKAGLGIPYRPSLTYGLSTIFSKKNKKDLAVHF
jgi:hypothetical protein